MDIQKELNALLAIAKKIDPKAYFIGIHSFGEGETERCFLNFWGPKSVEFETFAELKEHIENMKPRNEILFRKFSA